MIAVRALLSAIVLAAGAWLVQRFVIEPFDCNRQIGQVIRNSESAQRASLDRQRVIARENIQRLRHCRFEQSQIGSHALVLGANLELLGRWDEATAVYEHALHSSRRPELYLAHGSASLVNPNRQKAIDSFATAWYFTPTVAEEIPDRVAREEAQVIASNYATTHRATFERILGELYRGER